MAKKTIFKKLENITDISGKKEDKGIVYKYLDFEFNLQKIGDSATGLSMYKITPINFDNKELKSAAKRNYKSKGYSTIECENAKDSLMSILENIKVVKRKKEVAKMEYEKKAKEIKVKDLETKDSKDFKTKDFKSKDSRDFKTKDFKSKDSKDFKTKDFKSKDSRDFKSKHFKSKKK